LVGDTIKMNLKDIVCATVDFIHLAQNEDSMRDSVNTLTTFQSPK